jgi:hypothetical protein
MQQPRSFAKSFSFVRQRGRQSHWGSLGSDLTRGRSKEKGPLATRPAAPAVPGFSIASQCYEAMSNHTKTDELIKDAMAVLVVIALLVLVIMFVDGH